MVVYVGFALGALTNLVLAGKFDPDQYGLMNGMFVAVGTIMYAFANLGATSCIGKFYPYYKSHLPHRKNDLMTWALLAGLVGFVLVTVVGVLFRGPIVAYYSAKSPAMGKYYYWIFLFGFGITLFSLLEAYGWQVRRSILTNYLREVQFRMNTIILILLYLTGVLGGFDLFIKLFAFNYLAISLIMIVVLVRAGELHLVPRPSIVTRKFFSKIRTLALLQWSGSMVYTVAFFFAPIAIAGVVPGGLTAVGVFSFAQMIGSLIQAPQRGIAAAAIGPLSQAWKEKDYGRINRIYQRSSINQMIFAVGMFVLIWINYTDGILIFHIKPEFLDGKTIFFFIGMARLVDMGTGVNQQVIVTSTFWRFDCWTGMILVALTLPLNYIMAKEIGALGPAVADLATFAIYNAIRWAYLYRRFQMQPFTFQTLYAVLLGGAGYLVCIGLFGRFHGLMWVFARTGVLALIYLSGVLLLRLSPDVLPVWQTVKKRLGMGR